VTVLWLPTAPRTYQSHPQPFGFVFLLLSPYQHEKMAPLGRRGVPKGRVESGGGLEPTTATTSSPPVVEKRGGDPPPSLPPGGPGSTLVATKVSSERRSSCCQSSVGSCGPLGAPGAGHPSRGP